MIWRKDAPDLKKYQELDVQVMKILEGKKEFRGGINANDMGLGKTCNIFFFFFCYAFIIRYFRVVIIICYICPELQVK